MTNEETINRIREFGLHHAIQVLSNSALTVEAFEKEISTLGAQKHKELYDAQAQGRLEAIFSFYEI